MQKVRRVLLSRAIEQTADSVLIADKQGVIEYVNPAFERVTGYRKEEVLGKTPRILKSGKHDQAFYGDLWNTLLSGQSFHAVILNRKKNGEVYYDDRVISPIRDANGDITHFVATGADVTDRIRQEEEIRRLNEELEQRVRERTAQLEASVKELEAFSYSISHDLRAPLRALHGFSRILLEEYASEMGGDARRCLNILQENSQQMGALIDDLLAFFRLGRQPLNKQTVDPVDIVRQCVQELQHQQEGRNVEISSGRMPACRADPALLKQVFVNLLSNALKFTAGEDVASIEVGCDSKAGLPVYFVKDNGAGFDMRYADKLFQVFQRLHGPEEFPGRGVGLAMVQRIIHCHGGQVWAEAEVNRGATFFFSLERGR